MNGICIFTVNNVDHKLRFNLAGVTELERRLFETGADNHAVFTTTLLYGGMYGNAFREQLPTPKFDQAIDLLEELDLIGEDGSKILSDIWNAYQESRFGQDFKNFVNKAAQELADKKSEGQDEKKI